MTPRQIALVQKTWNQVLPVRNIAAELFYTKLFALDPALQALFRSNMRHQGDKLMAMISIAVQRLDRLDPIVPMLEDLGRRHVTYGARDSHYETVGVALLWTLERALGERCTPEVKRAWVAAYTTLTQTMKTAAAKAAA